MDNTIETSRKKLRGNDTKHVTFDGPKMKMLYLFASRQKCITAFAVMQ